jgi:hypothetical protein
MKKKNYLNNRDILSEIHKSKSSYCRFSSPDYHQYDSILLDVSKINIRTVADAKRARAKRLSAELDAPMDYRKVAKTDLVFRIMTFDHIPAEPGRKKNPKTVADTKVKVNFPPFQHYKFDENDDLVCVGKSHWTGDVNTGSFSLESGTATDKLATMWIKLCDRYATKGNVRGYTYNDEMKGQAILQLAQIGLQFDESKSANPFAYYTAAVTNSFVRIINLEKKNQTIRDDILEMNNMAPSYTRQAEGEWAMAQKREKEFQEQLSTDY